MHVDQPKTPMLRIFRRVYTPQKSRHQYDHQLRRTLVPKKRKKYIITCAKLHRIMAQIMHNTNTIRWHEAYRQEKQHPTHRKHFVGWEIYAKTFTPLRCKQCCNFVMIRTCIIIQDPMGLALYCSFSRAIPKL